MGLLLALLGLLSLPLMVLWLWYTPKISFRIGGDDLGTPIPLPLTGRVHFAVATRSKRTLQFDELRLSYDPDAVDLSKTKGATASFTTDSEYPAAIGFPGEREVVAGHLQGNYFDYAAKRPKFLPRPSKVSNLWRRKTLLAACPGTV